MLSLVPEGVVVSNTEGRLTQISKTVADIKEARSWSGLDASQLVGRLNFARSLASGRPLVGELFMLHQRAAQGRNKKVELTDDEWRMLEILDVYVSTVKPRFIRSAPKLCHALLYTDGAVEDGIGTAGAVLFIRGSVRVLSYTIPTELMESWYKLGSKHAVAQSELHPVLVSKRTWFEILIGVDVLHFTDNSSVKESL
eukprot:6480127-Amphidinium_carterae.1